MFAVREDLRCFPPFAPAYAHFSFSLARFACELSRFMTLSEVAMLTHLGWDTVKEILKSDLGKRYRHIALKDVKYLAIDEIHLGSKGRFVTVVIDLESGKILWVAKGRGGDALTKFFRKLRCARAKIKAVACDMSAAYWSAVLEGLPKADIVFDHFHIVKLANEKIDELRRALQREAGILGRQYIKGTRYLLLAAEENLTESKKARLEEALRFNAPLSTAYYLKERLRALWSASGLRQMRAYLEDWVEEALASGILQMISLAKTIRAHAVGILNYALHPISTGKLEGINNKIKTLKRKAYGYRDYAFFVLKLYSLHESKYRFTGC